MANKVADQLVETLEQAGVKRIYAVTGDSLNEVNEAVRKNGHIQWIHVRHEETGAYAAGAEAQLTGNLACCAGSSGPGHVHLINGLYDAHRSHASVLAIASTVLTHEAGTHYFQETDTIKLFDDCSYYNQLADTPEQVVRMLQGAMQAAISQKGVGVIGLPGDVAACEAAEPISSACSFPTRRHVVPDAEDLVRLARLLNEAEKITIYCGIGAKEAHKEVVELSQRLHAPVGYTFKAKMEIQYDNPNEVGMTGLLGMPSAYASMHDAEVLLLLGTDFPYESFMPDGNTIVQIDLNAGRLGRRAKLQMGLCGDCKDTLQALLPLLQQKDNDHFLREQLALYKKVKNYLFSSAQVKGKEDNIQPEYLIAMINEMAAPDAIFTVDTGMTCVWGARYLQATGQRKMLGSFNHGSMANALPQAIGASLSYPERQVFALCGDGGLSMTLGDLATVVQYKLPIKLVVFNNHSLGMVKLEMAVAGLSDWQTDMYNPDFGQVALSMGLPGYTIRRPEELHNAMQMALATPGPVLLNVITDPNALAMPPKIEFSQLAGYAQSMFKLMIHGRTKEVLDTINTNLKHWKEVL